MPEVVGQTPSEEEMAQKQRGNAKEQKNKRETTGNGHKVYMIGDGSKI